MKVKKSKHFAAHSFHDIESAPFSARDYSSLKFGCERVARDFGTELAVKFFDEYKHVIASKPVVVHSSPYNVVPNAATLMTAHFLNTLNESMVRMHGFHVDYSTHRS